MKVVHLVPAMEQGGVETVVCSLNRALVRAGHESVVISRGGRLVQDVVADGGRHVALDLKSKCPLSYFSRALRLRHVLSAEQADLVCVHSRVPAWLFAWANRSLSLPWISYAHGANSVSRYSAVMTRGDRVIVPSRFLADYLIGNYRDPTLRDRIRIVPNCVDLERFDPERLDAEYVEARRREWDVREGASVSMAVGRITPVKGLDNVIRDFAAHSRGPVDRLVIVGGADVDRMDCLRSLRNLAETLVPPVGGSPQVIFAGPQAKVPECLSLCTEVVVGNAVKPESFGLSVAEAYAMDKPVRLLRHFGGAAEIVDAVSAVREKDEGLSLRDAARMLYGCGIMWESTLSVYKELVR